MTGTVADIKEKADIVEIISERISVKKGGKHFKALCPFHGEKTPSFMISPELQIYKCFGCGESGDVITFLEKFEGMDFNEAIRYLSERTGVKLDSGNFQPKKDREKIIEINDLAAKYYNYILLKHPLGKEALSYLTQIRKLTIDTISKFMIGFSPINQKLFDSFFIGKKKLSGKDMTLTGIVYEKYGKIFDRFSGRVVFPLQDHRGNVVGFSGRIMPGANPDLAKYINTPETSAYYKSEILYGLNFTKSEIKNSGFAVVCEGELDMLSPWQRGVKNIVAIKGSALTEKHSRLLSRFTKNITLSLDADFAGDAAAKRGIEIAQAAGLKIKVARIKGFKDPDEMAISDIGKYIKCLESAVPVYDFIIDSAFEKYDARTVDGKSDISKEVVPFLSKIDDEIIKAYYSEKLAQKLSVPYESVYSEIEKKKIRELSKTEPTNLESPKRVRRELLEETLFILSLVARPEKLKEVSKILRSEFLLKIITAFEKTPGFQPGDESNADMLSSLRGNRGLKSADDVISKIKVDGANKEFNIRAFSENLPAELREKFNEIYLVHLPEIDISNKQKVDSEIDTLIKNISLYDLSEKRNDIIEEIKESEKGGNKKEVERLQRKLNDIIKTKGRLGGN